MDNSRKAELINKASNKISSCLGILDKVEDNQTVQDQKLTTLYYELLDKQNDLDVLAFELEKNGC